MRSFRKIILGGIIFLCLIILILLRLKIENWLVNLRILPQYFLDSSFSYETFQRLKLENKSLEQQLSNLTPKTGVPADRYHYLEASVYSLYPFNDRSLLTIDAGSVDGLKVGAPVLAQKGILLGKIVNVNRTQSEAQTIFDPNWRTSVVIGPKRYESLFIGGLNPHLELIAKDSLIQEGDDVSNLSAVFPLNFLIGNISVVKKDPTQTWLNASINLPYQFDSLRQVLVITDFP